MGSMNFGLFPMLARYDTFLYDWEAAHLEASRDHVFRNTFQDMERILGELGERCGTRFEFECYDVGHLYNLAHLLERGLVRPPLFVQTIFGILGGIGPDTDNLVHMKRTADALFGDDYHWSVLGAGRHQMGLLTMAAQMGGHVRVGLEDSLYIGKGQLADVERRPGPQDPADPRRAVARGRDARRGPRDARPQGASERRLLSARVAASSTVRPSGSMTTPYSRSA